MNALALARAAFWSAVAAGILVAFVWPFAVSADPAQPVLRGVTIAITAVLFASLAAVLVLRLRQRNR